MTEESKDKKILFYRAGLRDGEIELDPVDIDNKIFCSAAAVAERYGTTEGYLANRRYDSQGLSYYKIYGLVRYDLDDVVDYESSRRVRLKE